MIELIHKNSSKINIDDEEYEKMKQRILQIINQSLQDEVFYQQRLHVKLNESICTLENLIFFILLDM